MSDPEEDRIFFVGNVMIDTLLANRSKFIKPDFWDSLSLNSQDYFVLTLHRPANVDEGEKLKALIAEITTSVGGKPILFPMHPRTAKVFQDLGISAPNLHIVDPLSYLEFNYLVENAMGVITDSGGITEETTVMGVPCLTLRDSTERPETITVGTNELVGTDPQSIAPFLTKLVNGQWKKGGIPKKWDGHAAERIVVTLQRLYNL